MSRTSSTADSYVRQITDIEATLKRLNKQRSELQKKKKEAEQRLHAWMVKNGVEEYGKVKIKKVAPKPKAKRKPAKKKKDDALRLFSEIGVNDPEEFWEAFQRTQKVTVDAPEDDDT